MDCIRHVSSPLLFKCSIPEKDRDNIYNTCTMFSHTITDNINYIVLLSWSMSGVSKLKNINIFYMYMTVYIESYISLPYHYLVYRKSYDLTLYTIIGKLFDNTWTSIGGNIVNLL